MLHALCLDGNFKKVEVYWQLVLLKNKISIWTYLGPTLVLKLVYDIALAPFEDYRSNFPI
jgi:hypothetical protein